MLTDDRARGLTEQAVDAGRYRERGFHPAEAPGAMIEFVREGSRVLDVGCGGGVHGRLLVDNLGCQVIGIEPHEERAADARLLGLEVYSEYYTDELADRLGPFDAVVFLDVLEHLVDPFDMLKTALRSLAPGGCVVASVPNVAHWTVRGRLLRGRFDYAPAGIMDATHLRWFTRSTLYRLFDEAGYEIVDYRPSTGLWMPEYHRRPWRWLGPQRRLRWVRAAAYRWPDLFACQHIVKAAPKDRAEAEPEADAASGGKGLVA